MTTWMTLWQQAALPVRENLQGELEWRIDMVLLFITVSLMCISWVMVSSASIDYAVQTTGNPYYFAVRHGIYMVVAWLFMAAVLLVPFNVWRRIDKPFLIIAFVLLVAVLVPGIGKRINGSQRWINLGFMTLQASEVAKWAMVVFLSGYFVRQRTLSNAGWKSFFVPLAILTVMASLLMLEPDFGATVVIMLAGIALIFLAGAPLLPFSVLAAVGLGAAALLAMGSEYRMRRLLAFSNPWDEDVVYSSGYQLTQSLIAIGRGEWLGVGLGNSIQKLFYLPEAHTDFVFSIWAEETGLAGSLLIVGLFAGMAWRIARIARLAEMRGDLFAAFCVLGVGLLISFQAFINMGVASGLLPTKGLTLPFISYGGSSLIISAGMIGMALRLSFENRVNYPVQSMLVMVVEKSDE
jgi:cell division protein FtsW